MRKITLLFMCLCAVLPLCAQNSWEIKDKKPNSLQVGAVLMSIPAEPMHINPVGIQAGYMRALELGSKGWFVQGGVALQYLRARADFDKKDSPKRLDSNLVIGKVPVQLGYKWDLEHDTAFRLYAGGYAQYLLLQDAGVRFYELNDVLDFDTFWNKKLGYGLTVGAQYDFDTQWFGGVNFHYSLNPISDDEQRNIPLSTLDARPFAFELHIGYRF